VPFLSPLLAKAAALFPPAKSPSPLKKPSHPTFNSLTQNHADKAQSINGTMIIRKFIYYRIYKLINICAKEFFHKTYSSLNLELLA
jgi:hypothetical protein